MTKTYTHEDLSPELIHEIQQAINRTQEQFAQILGVSSVTMNRWQRGHSHPQGEGHKRALIALANKYLGNGQEPKT